MYNHKDAAETIQIFTKALGVGAEEISTHNSWAEHNMISAYFELGDLQCSASIVNDFAPGFIRASVWRKDGDNEDVVRVTAPAAIALATVNMGIAQHQLDTVTE